jgi:hypothetical protein
MKTTGMKKLALLLSLLALGGLGLVACGGGDDDQVTAASGTETTRDDPAADKKSCGSIGRYRFAVVYGDISCHVVRGVVRDFVPDGEPPASWFCDGSDAEWSCVNEAEDAFTAHARKKVLRRWRAAEAR